jgi:hypothetical protein
MHQGVVGGGVEGIEGVVLELVSYGTHKSLNFKTGDIICSIIPCFPSLIIYFLWLPIRRCYTENNSFL